MQIVEVISDFLPHSVGGTEVYVHALAKELLREGHCVRIAVLKGTEAFTYTHDGLAVDVLPAFETPEGRQLGRSYHRYLEKFGPQVVHFHPLYLPLMLPFMRAAKELGIPIVVTYHTPTVTCGRGDMMLWGKYPCDGRMDLRRCAACVAHQKGLPRFASSLLGASARAEPKLRASRFFSHKLNSMFDIPRQRSEHLQVWKQTRECIDHWVAVARWVKDVLVANGVPTGKITVSRQGFCRLSGSAGGETKISEGESLRHQANGTAKKRQPRGLRLGYLGRIHPTKGLHVLIKAMKLLNGEHGVTLRIAGAAAGPHLSYERKLRRSTRKDGRIRWLGELSPGEVPAFLAGIDLLAVPSICMETGPMTVLEAWAAGVPVLGSDRGGIREWIEEYGGGWLFEAGSEHALAEAVAELVQDRPSAMQVDIAASVRTMADVAREMDVLYRTLVSSRNENKCRVPTIS